VPYDNASMKYFAFPPEADKKKLSRPAN